MKDELLRLVVASDFALVFARMSACSSIALWNYRLEWEEYDMALIYVNQLN
jgi:hypothetical protein